MRDMDKKQKQFSVWYVFIALWALMLFQLFITPYFTPTEIPYSDFNKAVGEGKGEDLSVPSKVIHGRMKPEAAASEDKGAAKTEGRVFNTVRVEDPELVPY